MTRLRVRGLSRRLGRFHAAQSDAPARAGPFRAGKLAVAEGRGRGGWGLRGTARDGAGSGGAGALRNGEAEYGNKKEA